ncbi:hypothetical protein HYC85_029232 [Camellia sinensis]|uniref:Uncharacterized protein n=1 Tax=Camellia sinensis TaxID=4442 RepID=A0A7J7FYM5_CAMSI|nr:hypothetical protein HYC85_029232 [Camellia sinensis]
MPLGFLLARYCMYGSLKAGVTGRAAQSSALSKMGRLWALTFTPVIVMTFEFCQRGATVDTPFLTVLKTWTSPFEHSVIIHDCVRSEFPEVSARAPCLRISELDRLVSGFAPNTCILPWKGRECLMGHPHTPPAAAGGHRMVFFFYRHFLEAGLRTGRKGVLIADLPRSYPSSRAETTPVMTDMWPSAPRGRDALLRLRGAGLSIVNLGIVKIKEDSEGTARRSHDRGVYYLRREIGKVIVGAFVALCSSLSQAMFKKKNGRKEEAKEEWIDEPILVLSQHVFCIFLACLSSILVGLGHVRLALYGCGVSGFD